ncbi:MAG TPA: tetratricopeptide repeat protein [Verrucomicrobiae bacterium]|nr:tetratricopeptide repeat protein [Verrucomicrobiae bacterium]
MKTFWDIGGTLWLLLALVAAPVRAQDSNRVAVAELMRRGRAEMAANDREAAADDFRRAAEIDPTNYLAYTMLGYALAGSGQRAEAVTAYEKSIALNPGQTNVWLSLGRSYYAIGNYQASADALRQYVCLNTSNARAYLQLGNSLAQSGRLGEAIEAGRKAVALEPTDALSHSALGYYLVRSRLYEEAEDAFQAALSLNPKDSYSYLWLGICRYHRKAYGKAVSALQKCVAIETNNAEAYNWLGRSFEAVDHYNGAVTAYEKGLRIKPDDFGMNYRLGYSYAELRRFDRAEAAFRKAARLHPDDFDAIDWRAICLVRLGRFDEAATSFEKAHELNTSDLVIKRALFACYLLSARYLEARRLYPVGFGVSGGALLLLYVIVLSAVWRFSMRISTQPAPGLGLSISWLAVFFEGQLALMFCLALLSLIDISQNLLFGITLAGIPVIAAAVRGFARQPWGGPFAFPLRFGTARVIGFSLLGLAGVSAFGSWFAQWAAEWMHRAPDLQDIVPIIRFGLDTNPMATVVSVVIMAPICEEIIFRGLLYGALEGRIGIAGAILVSAFVFALVHLQITYFVALLCVGVVLGWARWKTGSLGLPIVLHIVNNGVALLVMKFLEKGV